ncbi:MAG: AbrB/MazE/SpoVT family DNA-binding domain-containing protein [Thermoproteota archaeon]|nr:AbrB/MazE/SpoVT family DNA-binding domain-containing protein [Thermoproteota archaeon]
MTVLGTAKVSSGFRITLPKETREYLKLKEGEKLIFYTLEGKLGRICFRKTGKK